MEIEFNRRKFAELLLYVAEESEDDPRFGATKLNKILYFSDFEAFGILGSPITGATYRRLERGPAPLEILPVLSQLQREGEAARVETRYFHLTQKRVKPLRSPDLSLFRADEIAIVDSVIYELRTLNASEVSALSHLEVGWQIARDGEVIPYHSAYLSDRSPTARERAVWEQVRDERKSRRR